MSKNGMKIGRTTCECGLTLDILGPQIGSYMPKSGMKIGRTTCEHDLLLGILVPKMGSSTPKSGMKIEEPLANAVYY